MHEYTEPEAAADEEKTLVERVGAPAADATACSMQATSPELPSLFEASSAASRPLGEYELLREIGRGGMGVVFEARHVRLHRTVALKMILGGALAHADDLQRFETEVAAAAQLQHPNIVALYEVGQFERQPYFSMEFISGRSLAQCVTGGPLPGTKAALLLEATARAVHYAHGRGIIHRDLKPANILLDEAENPKITDFGLAKVLSTDSGQTRTGTVLGTPSYIAPEQAAGKKDAVGPASDVYSLGAILYELLTAKPPFRGETALATLNQVAEQEAIPPRLLNPLVDRDLETICLKCLEKSPGARYVSAEALADDLRRYLDGEPITARRTDAFGWVMKWVKREPAAAALLAVTVFALLGFGFFGLHTAHTERQLRQLAEVRGEGMRRLLYLAQIRQAQQALNGGDAARAEQILSRWEPRPDQADLRHWEWNFLKARCQGRFALAGHSERVNGIAFRPDGTQLASAGGPHGKAGEIKIWDAETGSLLKTLTGHKNVITAIAYSPDGKLLFSASEDRTVRVWDAQTGGELQVLNGHAAHVTSLAYHPEGTFVVSGDGQGVIRIWQREPTMLVLWKLHSQLNGHTGEVCGLAFNSKGDLLASGGQDGALRIWKIEQGMSVQRMEAHPGGVSTLAFSPDGKALVSGGGAGHGRGEIKYWNPNSGRLTARYYGLSSKILSIAFSPRGKLAAGGSDGMIRLWDQQRSNEAICFRADTQVVYSVAFSPDGRRLAFAGQDGQLRLWNSTGGMEALIVAADMQAESVVIGPMVARRADRLLACCGQNNGVGEVQVWNIARNKLKFTLRDHEGAVYGVCFAPNASRLASGGEDGKIRVYDVARPAAAPLVLSGHTGRVLSLSYHPREDILASAADDDTIRVWDVSTGKVLQVLEGHDNAVLAVAFSPDGQLLASGSFDKTVRVWDLRKATSFALEGHAGSTHMVAFSPDGSQLASASSDKTIRIWKLSERRATMKLEGSPGAVHALAWHSSGHRLASAGQDSRVRLWDLVTGQEILDLDSTGSPIRSVAFSKEGDLLACAGPNQGVRVWDAPE